jgi:hypothetical protein
MGITRFTNEFINKGEGQYKMSLWKKNNGTEFSLSAGGVSSMEGNMETLIKENEQIIDWKSHEYIIDVPNDHWLRMELNILQPGSFWVDDIRIERI